VALHFSGSGQYARTGGTHADVNGAELTLAVMLYVPAGVGNAEFDRLFELGGYNTNQGGFELSIRTGSSLYCAVYTGLTSSFGFGNHAIPNDTWFPAVMRSRNPAGLVSALHVLRLNGVQVGRNVASTRLVAAARLTIGASNGDLGAQGVVRIDHMAIWNAYLTDAEVMLYELGVSPALIAPASLVRHWDFPDAGGSPATVTDLQGVQDLTVTGSPSVQVGPTFAAFSVRS
jgi:hypothetical protein